MKILRKVLFAILTAALLCGTLAFAASAEEPYSDTEGDFRYGFFEDYAAVWGYVGSGGAAVIPETVRGLPVTGVVSLGSGITSISIPRYVKLIYVASLGCDSLTSFVVDPLNEDYCAVDGVLFSKDLTRLLAYPIAKPDPEYTIPDRVQIDNSVCFFNVEHLIVGNNMDSLPPLRGKLRKITLPAAFSFPLNYETFNPSTLADYYCADMAEIVVHPGNPNYTVQDGILYNKSMTRLIYCPPKRSAGVCNIPDSVTEIAANAFRGCAGLTEIIVGGGNPAYSSQDGILFNRDKTTLILYPASKTGGTYTAPTSVTAIESYAFENNKNLTSATFPEGIASVGTNAFLGCTGLTLYGYYYTPLRTATRPTGVSFVAVDQPRIDSITITPAGTINVNVGDSVQFTVTIEGYNLRDETKKVTWYILASGGGQYVSTISNSGLFKVSAYEIQPLLQVGAYSTFDSSMRASANVIVKWPQANMTTLNAYIAQAEGKVNDTKYTEASRVALQTVLTNAKTVRDYEAPQHLVDATALVLRDAINALVLLGNKTPLIAKIAEAESKLNDPQYTESSRAGLQIPLEYARAVRDDPTASQASVDDAIADLNFAINALNKVDNKEYFTLWGKPATWEKKPFNWILLIVCFGWIWMAF